MLHPRPELSPLLLPRAPWAPDCGDGTYRNPVLHADYSDPDVIRVGDDYFLTASSFNCVPGLPILHSRDLVNWRLVNHALPRLTPTDHYATPRHGGGVWAPSIRHHADRFWITYGDPDFGLFVITANDPAGRWSEPVLVAPGRGLIDPCPLWDDDGSVYLVHGWARSRSGICNVLSLLRLSADGRRVEEDLGRIIDGEQVPHEGFHTLEGPKFYRRHGWYYVSAPAGGVATGWQSVFRARQIRGPYEHRVVLHQGSTTVNGPHQGAWVDTPSGESWFLHFQDQRAYGRVVHLQPMAWVDDWPVMGRDDDGDGTGEPVLRHHKPGTCVVEPNAPACSDDFAAPALGLQWQWQANPQPHWCSLATVPGSLRLFAQPEPRPANLYRAPHLLLQKFPAPEFTATTRLTLHAPQPGTDGGLIVFGYDYAWIGLRQSENDLHLVYAECIQAAEDAAQTCHVLARNVPSLVWLRVTVARGGACRFAWSPEGRDFHDSGHRFIATCGHWVGAKFGLFSSHPAGTRPGGGADFEAFTVTAHDPEAPTP